MELNSMPEVQTNPLDIALDLASRGDRAAARQFYQLLLSKPLTVIERFQIHNMTDGPKYPDPFLNMLAVESEQRALVPVFSSLNHVQSWCGLDLKVRVMSLPEILTVLPNDWWLVVNPGQEAFKEISPWELTRLKSGSRGIDEILEELYEEDSEAAVSLGPVSGDKHSSLVSKAQSLAHDLKDITAVYGALESWGDALDPNDRRFIIAVELAPRKPNQPVPEVSSVVSFERALAKEMIGQGALRVIDIKSCPPFLSDALRSFEPLYKRPASSSQAFLNWFRRLFIKTPR